MIFNTFVFDPVALQFIDKALETLYKYTDMTNNRVIVVDQTDSGIETGWPIDLYMKPHRNLGFAKSMNEGIIHGLRWKSKYITICNDDIEFMNKDWWNGVESTFSMGERVCAVNPESPRIPLWGYGRDHGDYIDIIRHKDEFTQADYDYLMTGDFSDLEQRSFLKSDYPIPDSFPRKKYGVTDAAAMWLTVFKRETFERFGLFDERFYPGGGEDYDMDGRIYRENGRVLGTTKSWVWHWWGQSKDNLNQIDTKIDPSLVWNNSGDLWIPEENEGNGLDPWGHYTDKNGVKKPLNRVKEIGIIDI